MTPNVKKRLFRFKLLLKLVSVINFYRIHRYFPSPKPKTFNDLIFKLKLEIDKDFLRCFVSDKEYVKDFIESTVGSEYAVPTIAILRNKEEIRHFFSKPIEADIVVKPTHMSGKCIFLKKDNLISTETLETIIEWLTINYFYITGEANYKDLLPKIIIEPSLCDEYGNVPIDYKIYCSRGKVVMIQVDKNRFSNRSQAFYSPNWVKLPIALGKLPTSIINAPHNLDKMLSIAEQVAQHFMHIRVDCYSIDNRIYIGEITNVYGNAGMKFKYKEQDHLIGQLILTGNYNHLFKILDQTNAENSVPQYLNSSIPTIG